MACLGVFLQQILIAAILVSTVLPSFKILGIGAEAREFSKMLECPPTCETDDDCLSVKGCGYGCVNKGAYKACSGVTARIGAETRESSQESVNSNTTLLECPPTCTTDDDCLSVKGCGYGCVNKGAYRACSGV